MDKDKCEISEDTIHLLTEVNSGCKNATNSMEQVKEYVVDKDLKELLIDYDKKHIEIGEEAHRLLNNNSCDEKDPGLMAKAFSYISTEMKLMMNPNNTQIAKIMMDGCNMGIQSIGEDLGKYPAADETSVNLAKKLIKIEEDFMSKMKNYL